MKTGGTWVRVICKNQKLTLQEAGNKHTVYCELEDIQVLSSRFTFAFVRHPCSWYQSFWSWKMRTGWQMDKPFDACCRSDTFTGFLEQCLEHLPHGMVSTMYEKFLDKGPPIDYIGRYENLIDDLILALSCAGEEFSEQAIRAMPPENQAYRLPEWRERCRYTPELLERVQEADKRAIERFGYEYWTM